MLCACTCPLLTACCLRLLLHRWVFPSRYYAVDFYPKSSGGRRLKQ